MGVLALQFVEGQNRHSLGLSGRETLNIRGLSAHLEPHQQLTVEVLREDGTQSNFPVLCRIDTANEARFFMAGGILHFVLRELLAH
jgi:aconitate hydratase